jgi:hypothetical protein
MRTFKTHKSFDVIKQQCIAAGLTFNDSLYLEQGADHVLIQGGGFPVTAMASCDQHQDKQGPKP